MLAKTKHFVRLISLFTTQNSSKRPNNPQFSHQNRRFCRQFEKLFIPLILLLISRKSNGVLLRKTNWEKREKKRNSGVLKNRFKSTYIPTTFLTSFSCPHEFIRKRPRGYIHLQSKKRCISIQYYYSTHLFSQFVDKNQIVHGQGGSRSKLQHHSQFIFDFFPAFITNLLFLTPLMRLLKIFHVTSSDTL